MGGMIIRDIRDSDKKAVLALWAETGLGRGWHDPEGDIAFAMKSDNSTILVADMGGDVLGSLMVGHDGHWGWVYYFGVSDNWRDLGVGRRLMDTAENWLRERGLKKVNLLVREDNLKVKPFYERIGFTEYPTITMQKLL